MGVWCGIVRVWCGVLVVYCVCGSEWRGIVCLW